MHFFIFNQGLYQDITLSFVTGKPFNNINVILFNSFSLDWPILIELKIIDFWFWIITYYSTMTSQITCTYLCDVSYDVFTRVELHAFEPEILPPRWEPLNVIVAAME